jgi:hypothetical protein
MPPTGIENSRQGSFKRVARPPQAIVSQAPTRAYTRIPAPPLAGEGWRTQTLSVREPVGQLPSGTIHR